MAVPRMRTMPPRYSTIRSASALSIGAPITLIILATVAVHPFWSWKGEFDSVTCDRISSSAVPLSPCCQVTATAGRMAISRVNNRRSTGGKRKRRKPSITTCPESVAVTVAD